MDCLMGKSSNNMDPLFLNRTIHVWLPYGRQKNKKNHEKNNLKLKKNVGWFPPIETWSNYSSELSNILSWDSSWRGWRPLVVQPIAVCITVVVRHVSKWKKLCWFMSHKLSISKSLKPPKPCSIQFRCLWTCFFFYSVVFAEFSHPNSPHFAANDRHLSTDLASPEAPSKTDRHWLLSWWDVGISTVIPIRAQVESGIYQNLTFAPTKSYIKVGKSIKRGA